MVTPEQVFAKIEPGMSIYIGAGVGEPRTLIKHLMASDSYNLQDLELIQLVSLGDAISLEALQSKRYRLKTFFSGWVASEAITAGRVDLIPSRLFMIPELIKSGLVHIDVAFVQITPPDEAGYCSLGVTVGATRNAIEQAPLAVGEINAQIPFTYGDTLVHISDFDMLVHATEPPLYFECGPAAPVFDEIAAKVASVIDDGSCIAFSIGPLFEALSRHLASKRHLGIHSPTFTDALMKLVQSGAVTNRYKKTSQGKALVSYASGTPELMAWLDRNPLVEFQSIDKVFNPLQIGRNPKFNAIFPIRKADLSGRLALTFGKGDVGAGPVHVMNLVNGAELSPGGKTIFALPSRNRKGQSNILISVNQFPDVFNMRESVNMVATEFGVANLTGRTVRERAQALIEIAHPQDRKQLVEQAKSANILYRDQIFLAESAHLYPDKITTQKTFKKNCVVRFRAIKPSDEEAMRRLFYRFSDKSVYYRYFTPIKTMPHARMQAYVNVDYRKVMSIVGLVGETGEGRIITEARFAKHKSRPWADVAFVVDEAWQGHGIATYLCTMLIRLGKEKGLQGFTADVLASNKAMMKVFEKSGVIVKATLESGVYSLTIPFG
ncbi:GNAT family N-acetyltransferase [Desulfococcaceae bacterium HSG9]|nr:GNAT family N-acetyltransferase [Desulfococcaceae bacterium HSG9]